MYPFGGAGAYQVARSAQTESHTHQQQVSPHTIISPAAALAAARGRRRSRVRALRPIFSIPERESNLIRAGEAQSAGKLACLPRC